MEQSIEVPAVTALQKRLGQRGQLTVIDPPGSPGDLLDASDLEALAVLDHAHVLGGLHHRLEGARVEPRGAAIENLHVERPGVEVPLVDGADLELPTSTRRNRLRDLHHPVVIEVESRYRVVALRLGGLLLDGDGTEV